MAQTPYWSTLHAPLMFHSITSINLLAADGSAPPPHQPAVGAFALLLLVIAVLTLLLVIATIIIMNHRRRASRADSDRSPQTNAVDPWKLAGQRLNPDSPRNDREA